MIAADRELVSSRNSKSKRLLARKYLKKRTKNRRVPAKYTQIEYKFIAFSFRKMHLYKYFKRRNNLQKDAPLCGEGKNNGKRGRENLTNN